MKQIYKPYSEWEDWQNGMWSRVDNENDIIKSAIQFTGDHKKYGKSMGEVITAWPNTMLNSLTNQSMNRKAFLGHCACCYRFGWPEYLVRTAWKELTDEQRKLANNEAQTRIDKWIEQYKNTLTPGRKDVTQVGYQMKLQLK